MLKIDRDNAIHLTRGDTARISLAVTASDGTAYDYSEDTVLFTVKANTMTADTLIEKTVTDGVINLTTSDTNGLSYQTYVYDVQLVTAGGDICTVIPPSKFIVEQEVTWQVS